MEKARLAEKNNQVSGQRFGQGFQTIRHGRSTLIP